MLVSLLTSWFGKRIGLAISKALPYLLGALLVVGAYYYIRWDAYNDGVDDTTERYEQLIQDERDRLQAANTAALEESRRMIAALQAQLRQRNQTLLELQREAAEDPNADRPAIGLDSVLRLNRID